MNWIVYDPEDNAYLQSTDRDGYPVKWVHRKDWAKWYSDKEIKNVLAQLRKFGFDYLEPQGIVKRK